VWSADVKGPFKTGDGHSCHPLTITEGSSRVRLSCQALSSTRGAEAKPVFSRVFTACGLPRRLRTDNSVPFATHTRARLSPLSAGWVRLGSVPACIEPGTPAPNGRHERRPRTRNAETTRPPGATLRAQPQQFTHCRDAFHHARPHEALDRRTPAVCYAPSPRHMPNTRPPLA
jgi:transposase InsO family protein